MLIKIRKLRNQSDDFTYQEVYTIIKLQTGFASSACCCWMRCCKWWSFIRLPFLTFRVLVPKLPFDAFYWLFELNNRFHCHDDVEKKMVGTTIGSFNIQHEHKGVISINRTNKVNEFILFNICCKSTSENIWTVNILQHTRHFYNLN